MGVGVIGDGVPSTRPVFQQSATTLILNIAGRDKHCYFHAVHIEQI